MKTFPPMKAGHQRTMRRRHKASVAAFRSGSPLLFRVRLLAPRPSSLRRARREIFSSVSSNYRHHSFAPFTTEDGGVTESVASFIAMYGDYKEQQEYSMWLKNLQSFTK